MEAIFPRKALAIRRDHFASRGVACSTKSPQKCIGCCQYSFWQEHVWVHHTASASDFKEVVLIRMLPGALSRLILPRLHRFNLLSGVYCKGSCAKMDSLENN